MLIPLVATLVAITLLPVILASIGPKLDRKRIRRRDRSNAFWQRWSEAVVRRRGLAAFAAVAILVALIVPATDLHLGNSDPDTIAKAGPAKQGLAALKDSGIGTGVIAPVETLAPEADAAKVASAQAKIDGVHGAVAPDGADWRRDGLAVVAAAPREGDETGAGRDAVQEVIDAAHDASPQARVGGSGPLNADFIEAVYGSFPLMIVLISLLTFVLLARGLPLAAAAGQGGRAQRAVRGRGLGRHGVRVAGGSRIRRAVGHRGHGLDRVLDSADGVRVPLRALDGLRGVHPRACARSTTRPGIPTRRSSSASPGPAGS